MRIIIIDDDVLVSTSIKTIIEATGEVEVLGLGKNGLEAIELYEKLKPELVLMDIRMGEMTGLEAGEKIMEKCPEAKILFLTTFSDDEYILKALKIGGKGYILKQEFHSILPALKAVNSGQYVYGEEIISRLPGLLKEKKEKRLMSWDLNEKELELISYVAQGLNNKEISKKLFLSEGTIRNYISIILDKLSLRDRTQIAIFYFKNLE